MRNGWRPGDAGWRAHRPLHTTLTHDSDGSCSCRDEIERIKAEKAAKQKGRVRADSLAASCVPCTLAALSPQRACADRPDASCFDYRRKTRELKELLTRKRKLTNRRRLVHRPARALTVPLTRMQSSHIHDVPPGYRNDPSVCMRPFVFRGIAEAKRAANIQAKEEARSGKGAGKGAGKGQQGSSKYSKKDVLELKKVFDEYDNDGSGSITLSEFTKTLRDKKKSSAPKPGQKSTLADRQAAAGISLADLGEGVFHEMDADGNGDVSFRELLKLMFKFARPDEIETMLEWVAPEAEPEPEPKAGLTDEQQKEIKSIFKIYDKDKSGTLTVAELVTALEKTGLEKDEIKDMFKNYDTDENATIDLTEFTKMMVDTGNYDPDM